MLDILYPYETLFGDLSLTTRLLKVDGRVPPIDPVVGSLRKIDLSSLERDSWQAISMAVEVKGPTEELVKMIDSGRTLQLTCVLACGTTNSRQTFDLSISETDPGMWLGEIIADREYFRGKATLSAVLTCAVDGLPCRFLGRAPEWDIYFDPPPVPIVEGTLRVQWVDFGSDTAPPVVRKYAKEYFYPDLQDANPIIYLNSSIPGLQQLLSDAPRRPAAERALHDAVRIGIAQSVWLALFGAALGALRDPDGDDLPELPAPEWKADVLKTLLPRMYPELGLPAALRSLLEARRGEEGLALQPKALMAINAHIKASQAIRRQLEALETVREESEQ